MKVSVVSNLRKSIPPLQPYRLAVSLQDPLDCGCLAVALFIVLFSDHTYLGVIQKAWLLMVGYLVHLVASDRSAPARTKVRLMRSFARPSRKHSKPVAIYPSVCSVSITTVKWPEMLFCISIASDAKRWEVWRDYSSITDLHTALSLAYPSVSVPSLPSFEQVMREFRRTTSRGGMISMSLTSRDDDPLDCPEFLSSLAREGLSFLKAVLLQSPLNHADCVYTFLSLPCISGARRATVSHRRDLIQDPSVAARFHELLRSLAQHDAASSLKATSTNIAGFCKGKSLADFSFLDKSAEARSIGRDIRTTHGFRVRGPTYLRDKLKVDAGPTAFRFLLFEYIEVDRAVFGDRHDHIARFGLVRKRLAVLGRLPDLHSVFVVNIQLPGDPPISSVAYFGVPKTFFQDPQHAKAAALYRRFCDLSATGPQPPARREGDRGDGKDEHDESEDEGDGGRAEREEDEEERTVNTTRKAWGTDIVWPSPGEPGVLARTAFQNLRFKFIPQMVEAPWVLRAAVSSTPCLLGQKIVQRYFQGPGYLEVDLHVGSSAIADNIVSLCRVYSNAFSISMGIVLQGESEEELPEEILAAFMLHRGDLNLRVPIDHSVI